MKNDKLAFKTPNGFDLTGEAHSSPAFYICIFDTIVGVFCLLSGVYWLFIATAIFTLIVFVGLLIFKPQNMMDSQTLYLWAKTFIGSKDRPKSISEGEIVKTETQTISAKASVAKQK